ncbi:hypothetical protein M378DRAFT_173857, partial [Amanita muscaria Koide BX008]
TTSHRRYSWQKIYLPNLQPTGQSPLWCYIIAMSVPKLWTRVQIHLPHAPTLP